MKPNEYYWTVDVDYGDKTPRKWSGSEWVGVAQKKQKFIDVCRDDNKNPIHIPTP